jgi:putative membrane protein
MDMIDLILACLHHLLILMYAGVFIAEAFLVRPGLTGANLALVARLDAMYGGIAGAIILVGIGRVFFGLKGWEYYIYNWAFWAKMAAFLTMGLLSTLPTGRILKWRKAAAGDPGFVVPDGEIAAARNFIRAEAIALALVPIFAAMMARGIGYF